MSARLCRKVRLIEHERDRMPRVIERGRRRSSRKVVDAAGGIGRAEDELAIGERPCFKRRLRDIERRVNRAT